MNNINLPGQFLHIFCRLVGYLICTPRRDSVLKSTRCNGLLKQCKLFRRPGPGNKTGSTLTDSWMQRFVETERLLAVCSGPFCSLPSSQLVHSGVKRSCCPCPPPPSQGRRAEEATCSIERQSSSSHFMHEHTFRVVGADNMWKVGDECPDGRGYICDIPPSTKLCHRRV